MSETPQSNEILVGIDGTDRSSDALHLARWLSKSSGARLVLVRAYAAESFNLVAGSVGWNRILEAESVHQLDEAAALVRSQGEVERVAVPVRSAARALQGLAEERGASMVVVGSTHSGTLGRVLLGTTAQRLLHGSPCPVAVAPHGYARASSAKVCEVGVGWDGGPEAGVALEFAVRLATTLACGIRLVRSFDTAFVDHPGWIADYPLVNELRDLAHADLEQTLRRMPDSTRREGRLIEGDPAQVLAGQSESLDLLVCGSRGYGPLRGVLLGSVTGRVLTEAACPVIVVPRRLSVTLGTSPVSRV